MSLAKRSERLLSEEEILDEVRPIIEAQKPKAQTPSPFEPLDKC